MFSCDDLAEEIHSDDSEPDEREYCDEVDDRGGDVTWESFKVEAESFYSSCEEEPCQYDCCSDEEDFYDGGYYISGKFYCYFGVAFHCESACFNGHVCEEYPQCQHEERQVEGLAVSSWGCICQGERARLDEYPYCHYAHACGDDGEYEYVCYGDCGSDLCYCCFHH